MWRVDARVDENGGRGLPLARGGKFAFSLDMVDFLGAVVGVCVFLGLLFLANLRRGDSSGSQ